MIPLSLSYSSAPIFIASSSALNLAAAFPKLPLPISALSIIRLYPWHLVGKQSHFRDWGPPLFTSVWVIILIYRHLHQRRWGRRLSGSRPQSVFIVVILWDSVPVFLKSSLSASIFSQSQQKQVNYHHIQLKSPWRNFYAPPAQIYTVRRQNAFYSCLAWPRQICFPLPVTL